MMTRMQNLDDVTDVQLSKSARKERDVSEPPAPARRRRRTRLRPRTPRTASAEEHHQVRHADRVRRRARRDARRDDAGRPRLGDEHRAGDRGRPERRRDRSGSVRGSRRDAGARARRRHAMKVTARDRYILLAAIALAAVAAYWFLGARTEAREGRQARQGPRRRPSRRSSSPSRRRSSSPRRRSSSRRLYASVGRLGKAVPRDEDVPSLLVQLNHAAAQSGRRLPLGRAEARPRRQARPRLPRRPRQRRLRPGATGASARPVRRAQRRASATTADAGGATATGAATGTLQPLPFQYKFKGNFYSLKNLIHNVSRLVDSRNRQLAISGRLIVIQGFALKRGQDHDPRDQLHAARRPGPLRRRDAGRPGGGTIRAAPQRPPRQAVPTPAPPTAAVTTP